MVPVSQGSLPIADLESSIAQIRGVLSARIVGNDEGGITEVHVLADSGRSPRQVVRDVESACMAQFGVRLDHRKISVAKIESDDSAFPDEERIGLEEIGISAYEEEFQAMVRLSFRGVSYVAREQGPYAEDNMLKLPARATLRALEDIFRGTCSFVLEDVASVPMKKCQAMVVLITLVTLGGEESLVGTSFTRRDEIEAVVKAALHAVNRRITVTFGDEE